MTGREFSVKCEKCGKGDTYKTTKAMPDQVIAKRFKEKGWLLGRNNAHDVCPECLGVSSANKLASVFKVKDGAEPVPPPAALVEQAETERAQQNARTQTALHNFLTPKKEESPVANAVPTVTPVLVQTGLTLEQTLELSRSLDGMAKGMAAIGTALHDLTAAMQLMTEEQSMMRNAVAQIVPAIVKQTGELNYGLQKISDQLTRPAEEPVVAATQDAEPDTGTEGQDRESYSDTQDRESYYVPDEPPAATTQEEVDFFPEFQPPTESLGDFVKRVRTEKKMGQSAVARKAGLAFSGAWLSLVESGQMKKPGYDKLGALAECLGIDVHELTTRREMGGL